MALQYQVAVKVIRGRPARVPVTIIRRPATVPASSVPAAMVSFSGVTATSPVEVTESIGRPTASATSRIDGPNE